MASPDRCDVERGDAGGAVGIWQDGVLGDVCLRRTEPPAEEQAEGKHEEAARFHLPAL
jgi:hypothetical protein